MEIKSRCQTNLVWIDLELAGGSGFKTGGNKSLSDHLALRGSSTCFGFLLLLNGAFSASHFNF